MNSEGNANKRVCLLHSIQKNSSIMVYNERWSSWHYVCLVLSCNGLNSFMRNICWLRMNTQYLPAHTVCKGPDEKLKINELGSYICCAHTNVYPPRVWRLAKWRLGEVLGEVGWETVGHRQKTVECAGEWEEHIDVLELGPSVVVK